LRIVQLIGAIRGGLFSESFVFELSNLGLGLIEFGLQLNISFDGVGVPALPIDHFATQFRVLTSQFAVRRLPAAIAGQELTATAAVRQLKSVPQAKHS
jgi:hypothetical protein